MIELRLCSSSLVKREAVVWKLLRFGLQASPYDYDSLLGRRHGD